MASVKKSEDRRVQRTRQALQQAFVDVVREKGFAATSIQDITERANVNRGTFYLHFTDKYMLVETFVREDFQRLLAKTIPSNARWDRKTLHLLIYTLLHQFERKYHHQRHIPQMVSPLIERAIHEELTELLLTWLKQSEAKERRSHVPMETIARIVSWSIFGTAIEWSQEESAIPLEQMASAILTVVLEGVAHLLPDEADY